MDLYSSLLEALRFVPIDQYVLAIDEYCCEKERLWCYYYVVGAIEAASKMTDTVDTFMAVQLDRVLSMKSINPDVLGHNLSIARDFYLASAALNDYDKFSSLLSYVDFESMNGVAADFFFGLLAYEYEKEASATVKKSLDLIGGDKKLLAKIFDRIGSHSEIDKVMYDAYESYTKKYCDYQSPFRIVA